jgi:hypothetical protein
MVAGNNIAKVHRSRKRAPILYRGTQMTWDQWRAFTVHFLFIYVRPITYYGSAGFK